MTTDCAVGEPVPSETSELSETAGATGIRVKTIIDASVGGVLPPVVAIESDLAPATDLISIDLIVGAGDPVKPGAAVMVNYCGLGQTTRTMFDASWIRGEPLSFGLNQVIAGWTEGIPGMKPGGRRLLIIPGALAYGPNPPTSAILPNETLIFVVDLISSAK
ncbi:MAG: FKBP-type peptidyl-prolyl cis-trans isomerase [Actinobacteria bacterium]|nr:FKBP-type peptidyl-prolyl cis-trans isomerase [Actinomycetota bacterium]